MSAPYQAIRCADGYIIVAAANDRLFDRFSTLLGHPEWPSRPEYVTDTARVGHRAALAGEIEAVTVAAPRAHWLALLEAHDVPCGPINDYGQVFVDRQVLARGLALETDHPALGRIRTLGTPIKMKGTPLDPTRRAPLLGEHADEVLSELFG